MGDPNFRKLSRSGMVARLRRLAFVAEPLELRYLRSVVYVDSAALGPVHDGSTWAKAFIDLQPVLSAAVSGTQIDVAQGTYCPASDFNQLDATFRLKSGVSLYGSFAGSRSVTPDVRDTVLYPTILSGNFQNRTQVSWVSHIVTGSGVDSTAILDGFTVTMGNAGSTAAGRQGGGMYNASGSPTVANCTFSGNVAYDGGAGMYNISSSPTIINCMFRGNTTFSGLGYGAGIHNVASAPTLTGCTIMRNTANYGGGMMNETSSPTLINCAINGNVSLSYGGGIYNTSSPAKITNCTFVGNSASNTSQGGAIFDDLSAAVIVNCDFYANFAKTGRAIGNITNTAATIANCIIWDTTGSSFISDIASVPGYSDILGTAVPNSNGNINSDPIFFRVPTPGLDNSWGSLDDDYGDLRIQAWSPAVDAGKKSAVPAGITADFSGNLRFSDLATVSDTGLGAAPMVDMGAYEVQGGLQAFSGGPYVVLQGKTITLAGHGVGSVAGTLKYAWDWTGDGLFKDSAIAAPVFSSTGRAASILNVSLKVTDSARKSTISSTSLTISPPTLYVDPRATGGAHTGFTWADALPDLAPALNGALAGQTIRLAMGTYYPTASTDYNLSFTLRNSIALSGGYAGYGAPNPDAQDLVATPSILSGDIGVQGTSSDNSSSVVTAVGTDATAVLSGFTITAGFNGLHCTSAAPTVSDCVFSKNGSSATGGGMSADIFSNPSFVRCTFVKNKANVGGAAGLGSGSFVGCVFEGNTAASGGAVYQMVGTTTFTNCLFVGNSATAFGGALYLMTSSTIKDCTITGNTAPSGDALYCSAGTATLANNVIWANTGSTTPFGGSVTATTCDIQGGFTGVGNINLDPLFIRSASAGADSHWGTADDDYGDLRLQISSPCVDTGGNGSIPSGVTTDLLGAARKFDFPGNHDPGVLVDMGAYELGTDLGAIQVANGQTFVLPIGGYIFKVEQLTLGNGARLDLNDDALIYDYTGSSPFAAIRASIATAFNDGGWNGPGINSTAANLDNSHSHALGYAESSDLGIASFMGQPIDTTSILIRYTKYGDNNLDGVIDVGNDFSLFLDGYSGHGSTWLQGDFTYDGKIDLGNDFNLFLNSYANTAFASPAIAPAKPASANVAPAVLTPSPIVFLETESNMARFFDENLPALFG